MELADNDADCWRSRRLVPITPIPVRLRQCLSAQLGQHYVLSTSAAGARTATVQRARGAKVRANGQKNGRSSACPRRRHVSRRSEEDRSRSALSGRGGGSQRLPRKSPVKKAPRSGTGRQLGQFRLMSLRSRPYLARIADQDWAHSATEPHCPIRVTAKSAGVGFNPPDSPEVETKHEQ